MNTLAEELLLDLPCNPGELNMRNFVPVMMLAVSMMCTGLMAQTIPERVININQLLADTQQKLNEAYTLRVDTVAALNTLRTNHENHVLLRPFYLGAFCYDFSADTYNAKVKEINAIIRRVEAVSNLNANSVSYTHPFGVWPELSITQPLLNQYDSARRFSFTVLYLYTLYNPTIPGDVINMTESCSRAQKSLKLLNLALGSIVAELEYLHSQAIEDIQSESLCWQTFLDSETTPVGPPVLPPSFPDMP